MIAASWTFCSRVSGLAKVEFIFYFYGLELPVKRAFLLRPALQTSSGGLFSVCEVLTEVEITIQAFLAQPAKPHMTGTSVVRPTHHCLQSFHMTGHPSLFRVGATFPGMLSGFRHTQTHT